MKLDVTDDAELLLENVLVLAPDYHAARYEYAHGTAEAPQTLARAARDGETARNRSEQPRLPHHLCDGVRPGSATTRMPCRCIVKSSAEAPDDPELHLSIAHALKTLGRTQEAIESYRAAAAARPRYGEAYWSLANLKIYRFTDAEIAAMRAGRRRPSPAGRPLSSLFRAG